MDTKEAIEFIDRRICDSPKKDQIFNLLQRGEEYIQIWEKCLFDDGHVIDKNEIILDKTIIKIKRGDKFEKMWEELNEKCQSASFELSFIPVNFYALVNELKQKYFPEPKIETLIQAKINVNKICKEVTEFHEKLLKKYFPKED